ncbi:NUDIX domain-containing protein [Streptomyces griseoaurantiacus]|uniref:NUDIX domain-containing protein n=1 Tax=Streptomyces griseoaurantiacus TaxID=68213 RepID=A0A7W2DS51_9ACTN|nr:NUDIX domain-containing protein [Streptomyces griseoaurantiacus]MBA5221944.1 NUDIX domain-containing protein [Streptomyces griseoaurantiacus]
MTRPGDTEGAGAARHRRSAGLLLFRRAADGGTEVLLGHMGGPYYARKEAGAWTVPKGEYPPEEHAWEAARREFEEELGLPPPDGTAVPLGEVRQAGGKVVTAWAVRADLDPATVVPGTFGMEWPPRSGRRQEFPELDRVRWFPLAEAHEVIVKAQAAFLDRLAEHSDGG